MLETKINDTTNQQYNSHVITYQPIWAAAPSKTWVYTRRAHNDQDSSLAWEHTSLSRLQNWTYSLRSAGDIIGIIFMLAFHIVMKFML